MHWHIEKRQILTRKDSTHIGDNPTINHTSIYGNKPPQLKIQTLAHKIEVCSWIRNTYWKIGTNINQIIIWSFLPQGCYDIIKPFKPSSKASLSNHHNYQNLNFSGLPFMSSNQMTNKPKIFHWSITSSICKTNQDRVFKEKLKVNHHKITTDDSLQEVEEGRGWLFGLLGVDLDCEPPPSLGLPLLEGLGSHRRRLDRSRRREREGLRRKEGYKKRRQRRRVLDFSCLQSVCGYAWLRRERGSTARVRQPTWFGADVRADIRQTQKAIYLCSEFAQANKLIRCSFLRRI